MEAGIVGLPNVGKSTLFNALTAAGIPSENYPFCTIEPNVGVVSVPDPRLATLISSSYRHRHVLRHATAWWILPATSFARARPA